MKKRIFALFGCMVLLCTLFVFTAGAEGTLLVDEAELLNPDEASTIMTKLNEVSNELDCDLVIVTTRNESDLDIYERSVKYYNDEGYGRGEEKKDGVILFIIKREGEGNSDYHITSFGKCKSMFTVSVVDSMCDKVEEKLADGNYTGAFETFIKETRSVVKHKTDVFTFQRLLVALAIGAVIGFIVVTSMKAKLKSVRFQPEANNYLKPGSLNVTLAEEHFLYHTVTRTARPKNNSSSGGSHGSGGGHGGGHF